MLIENVKGELIVRREVKFVYGFQAELDRLYGWGLQWGRGYKTQGAERTPAGLGTGRLGRGSAGLGEPDAGPVRRQRDATAAPAACG